MKHDSEEISAEQNGNSPTLLKPQYLNPASGSQATARFFSLLWALVVRDITSRYRRSSLGMWWAFLQPLILMLLFNMLRGFVNIPSDGIPYILFSFSALVPWTFFTNAVAACGPSITTNAEVIKKIALPREVFPLAAVTATLFDFVMSGLILAGMLLYFKIPLTLQVLWIPILSILMIAIAFGPILNSGVAVCHPGHLSSQFSAGTEPLFIHAESNGRSSRRFPKRLIERRGPATRRLGIVPNCNRSSTGDLLAHFPEIVRILR